MQTSNSSEIDLLASKGSREDILFRGITLAFALSIPLLLFALFLVLTYAAWPSIREFGLGFIVGSEWDPVLDEFGALPFIYGTLVSSLLALCIAVPLGVGTAIYLAESSVSSSKLKGIISQMVELLAAIPSIVYGLWGIFVLGPWIRNVVGPFFQTFFGFLPFFQGPVLGLGMMAAGIILAIMILPTITAVSREVFQSVPNNLRESAQALGTTQWETFRLGVMGPARSGILGAVILGLGRALGETMAVTMVIGNRPEISASLFAPAHTLASVIANEFTEAVSTIYLSVLVEIGLVLLFITVIVNGLARWIVWQTSRRVRT